MSRIASLPYVVRLLLVVALITSIVLYSASLVLQLEDEENRGKHWFRSVPLLVGSLCSMLEIAIFRCVFLDIQTRGLTEVWIGIPHAVHVLLVCVLLGNAVWSVVQEGQYRNTHFVRSSIKEAVDTMPVGLCFADLQGRPVLVNRRMAEFAEQLTGQVLVNATLLLESIRDEQIREDCYRMELFENPEEDIYLFRMPDGQVLQLTADFVKVASEKYLQLVVTDITMQHDLYENLRETNEALERQRQELRGLAERLIQSNHEEELLNYKIQVHNDVGQMIMTTGQVLNGPENRDEYVRCADEWIELAERFANMEGEKNQRNEELMAEIVNVAAQIGCKVTFATQLPKQIAERSVVRQAIREAVVNAVRHGGADEVIVSHSLANQMIEIQISNNGTIPAKGFSMRGGLKNLYDSIRGDGGDFKAQTGEQFALILSLPYVEQGA